MQKGTAPLGGRYARDYSSQADTSTLTEIDLMLQVLHCPGIHRNSTSS